MAFTFDLEAIIDPTIRRRDADREAQKVEDSLDEVEELELDVDTDKIGSQLGGSSGGGGGSHRRSHDRGRGRRGGGMMGGAAGGGGLMSLVSRGALAVSLKGVVALGLLAGLGVILQQLGLLAPIVEMLSSAMRIFIRPMGVIIGVLFGGLVFLIEMARRVIEWLDSGGLGALFSGGLEKLFDGAIGLGQWLFDGAIGLGRWLFDGAIGLGQWLFSGAVGLGQWLWSGAVGLGRWLFSGAVGLGQWLFSGAIGLGQWLFSGAVGLGQWLWADKTNLGQWMWSGTVGLGRWLWSGTVGLGRWLWSGSVGLGRWVWSGTIGLGRWLWSGTVGLGRWLWSGTVGLGRWLWSGAVGLGQWLFSGAVGLGRWLFSGSTGLGRWLWSGTVSLGQWLWSGTIWLGEWMWSGAVSIIDYISGKIDLSDFVFWGDNGGSSSSGGGGGGGRAWYDPRRYMASGGLVTGPTSAVVGEDGDEVVAPYDSFISTLDRERDRALNATSAAGATGGGLASRVGQEIAQTIDSRGGRDGRHGVEQIGGGGGVIEDRLKRVERAIKNLDTDITVEVSGEQMLSAYDKSDGRYGDRRKINR